MAENNETLKIRLQPRNPMDGAAVIFHASAELSENQTVNYKAVDAIHMPGQFHAYNNTSSRNFSITQIKLFSRTSHEASMNMARVNLLRSWTKSKFGQEFAKSKKDSQGAQNEELLANEFRYYLPNGRTHSNTGTADTTKVSLGLPPAVLELSAYSNATSRGNIYKVPVIITNLSVPYPTDVDYIPTIHGTPFPIIMNINIEATEAHSPSEYFGFNIVDYRRGELLHF